MTNRGNEDETGIAVVNTLVNKAGELDAAIALANHKLGELVTARVDLVRHHIPDAMAECGLTEFVTDVGVKVKLNEMIFGKILDEDAAHQWLMESGNGAIIKTKVSTQVDRGDQALLTKLLELLEANNFSSAVKSDIHHKTLNKFVGECQDEGIEVPECIKITKLNEAKIKNV